MSKGFIFSLLASLCWAILILLTRFMLASGTPPVTLFFFIVLFEFPFWIYMGVKHRRAISALKKKDFFILFLMAIVSSVCVNLIEFMALANTSAVNFSFLIRTSMVFTVVFAYFFVGEKFTKKKLIISGLILAGAYLLTTNGTQLILTKGDLFTLLEAALIAFGNNILGKMATNRMSPWVSATASQILGFFGVAAVSLYMNVDMLRVPSPLLLVVAAITGITLTLFRFRAYSLAPVSFVTMIFSFTPVFVTLMAIPLLGETVTLIQLLGGGLIVAAGIAVEKIKI